MASDFHRNNSQKHFYLTVPGPGERFHLFVSVSDQLLKFGEWQKGELEEEEIKVLGNLKIVNTCLLTLFFVVCCFIVCLFVFT